jgi:hypothetical protein
VTHGNIERVEAFAAAQAIVLLVRIGAARTQQGIRAQVHQVGSFGSLVELSSDGGVVREASSRLGHFSVTWQQRSAPWRIRARFGP